MIHYVFRTLTEKKEKGFKTNTFIHPRFRIEKEIKVEEIGRNCGICLALTTP